MDDKVKREYKDTIDQIHAPQELVEKTKESVKKLENVIDSEKFQNK